MIHVRQNSPGWIHLVDSETFEGHTVPIDEGSRHTMSHDCSCGPTLGFTQFADGTISDAYKHEKSDHLL